MLDGTISKEELAELLRTPLNPDLDYFDATASIEAMAKHIDGLHKLIYVMFESLTLQGASLIAQRKEIVEIKADLLGAGIDPSAAEEPALVGFDEPSIILPPGRKAN